MAVLRVMLVTYSAEMTSTTSVKAVCSRNVHTHHTGPIVDVPLDVGTLRHWIHLPAYFILLYMAVTCPFHWYPALLIAAS